MKNAFTLGCTNFQKSTVSRHASLSDAGASGQHFRAVNIVKQQSFFKKSSESAVEKVECSAEKQLRTVYWLAKEEIPEHKFSSLIELQVSKKF